MAAISATGCGSPTTVTGKDATTPAAWGNATSTRQKPFTPAGAVIGDEACHAARSCRPAKIRHQGRCKQGCPEGFSGHRSRRCVVIDRIGPAELGIATVIGIPLPVFYIPPDDITAELDPRQSAIARIGHAKSRRSHTFAGREGVIGAASINATCPDRIQHWSGRNRHRGAEGRRCSDDQEAAQGTHEHCVASKWVPGRRRGGMIPADRFEILMLY